MAHGTPHPFTLPSLLTASSAQLHGLRPERAPVPPPKPDERKVSRLEKEEASVPSSSSATSPGPLQAVKVPNGTWCWSGESGACIVPYKQSSKASA